MNPIQRNLGWLKENLKDLSRVIAALQAKGIIQNFENDIIRGMRNASDEEKAAELLKIVSRKSWVDIEEMFLHVLLEETGNSHCADRINQNPGDEYGKWLPEYKSQIQNVFERNDKNEKKSLVKVVHEKLRFTIENQGIVAICNSEVDKRYSGINGGVGKTLTAISYAHCYSKRYDKVIWIDCGRHKDKDDHDSLCSEFEHLAKILTTENSRAVEFNSGLDYARHCFEILSIYNCLWIYDGLNMHKDECRIVEEKFLPKQDSFHFLITSRSRNWGTENSGYGKIENIQLGNFTEMEGIQFFEKNLPGIDYTQYDLKQLCRLVGYLPFALQLVARSLNNKEINLRAFIDGKTPAEDFDKIVNAKFDDYGTTIKENANLDMGIFQTEEYGNIAYEVLSLMALVNPSKIVMQFLKAVLDVPDEELCNSIDLLVKYSFCTTASGNTSTEMTDVLEIHPLLQLLIRYNNRENDMQTDDLQKILGCHGYLYHKITTFVKFADENLQSEFKSVEDELLSNNTLPGLLMENKFDEAVELSRFVNRKMKTMTCLYNYALCLKYDRETEEAGRLFWELYKQVNRECNEIQIYSNILEMELLPAEQGPTKELVFGQLISIYCEADQPTNEEYRRMSKAMLEQEKTIVIIYSKDVLNRLFEFLAGNQFSGYFIQYDGDQKIIRLQLGGKVKKLELKNCRMETDGNYPINSQQIDLENVSFAPNLYSCQWIPRNVDSISVKANGTECQLSLQMLSSIRKYISLTEFCILNLDFDNRISLTELQLNKVGFTRTGTDTNVTINELIDFRKLKKLTLACCKSKINICIDLSEDSVSLDYLELKNVEIKSWKESNWKVKKLVLRNIHFQQETKMEIKELEVFGNRRTFTSIVDLSYLPKTIEMLSIKEGTSVISNGKIWLPNFKCLALWKPHILCLQHFNFNLTKIHFDLTIELNISFLPESVREIKFRKTTPKITGVKIINSKRHLDLLILERIDLDKGLPILDHFEANEVVLSTTSFQFRKLDNVMPLIVNHENQTPIAKIIYIGIITFPAGNDNFWQSNCSNHVGNEIKWYLIENGHEKAIEEEGMYNKRMILF